MSTFNKIGTIPVRAFGSYQVSCKNPKRMFQTLLGSRNYLDIESVEELVQGQVVECLPEAVKICDEIAELNRMQDKISKKLEELVRKELLEFGVSVRNIQIQSITPPQEVMDALESRVAMNLIGDQKKYLLYKTANSLDALAEVGGAAGGDTAHLMMGLMLGKGMLGMEGPEQTKALAAPTKASTVMAVEQELKLEHQFCFHCGVKQ